MQQLRMRNAIFPCFPALYFPAAPRATDITHVSLMVAKKRTHYALPLFYFVAGGQMIVAFQTTDGQRSVPERATHHGSLELHFTGSKIPSLPSRFYGSTHVGLA